MGIIAELIQTVRSYAQRKNGSPGEALIIEGEGLGDVPLTAEAYGLPGIAFKPTKGTRAVFLPVGISRRNGVIVSYKNYKVSVVPSEGGITIYSTDSNGSTVGARIELDNTGKVKIANASSSVKTVLDARQTALLTFATAASSATTAPQIAAAAAALVTALGMPSNSLALIMKD